ncbi:GIY-YIG nuclease family protein [Romeria aff. gracilis LEGE 07310]|uniref:GIY-YIG nuclease family protein n=1 Tax=Vasconcelosia minhoensis LEGE 07310 TaxID=915328 RepID=A0A8J7DCI1_9CYAN|nr:GIY-YIG nuclease family protein [Romeria gracilis]MBE9077708.1 GIY-YIG nuclease family protein [Romeria aff. gracilis LEGE 07310]
MPAPSLSTLPFHPYLTPDGQIATEFAGVIGIYAIYDEGQTLQYVGISRDVAASLKQHLIRQPEACYWVKVHPVKRPSRTELNEIRDAWIAENGSVPPGNGERADAWEKPIDVRALMTPAEIVAEDKSDGLGRVKIMKQIARRIEADLLEKLKARGVQMELRFNPKLKEDGLLDLK